ncbi:hypothetical protein Rhe02_49170 [Rhizocola hellebori]|uniref:Tetratricopeptide repeat protein n=1 Tax=Rhizocola hellebori TaxID=1392758 RepID=A0A8J3VHU0_9ACTN|nr:hypothetical protein Rhe02_49170 [Rhizocola hellebori]
MWFLIAKLFTLNELPAGQFASGFVFGAGVFLLLAACHQAPVAPVVAARWRRSLLLGVQCAAAFWFVGASVFGSTAGWLMAATGGLTALLADRRTAVDKTVGDVYRWMLAVVLLAALGEVLIAWVISGHLAIAVGVAAAVLVCAVAPVGNFPRWCVQLAAPLPAVSLRPASTQNLTSLRGYRAETLAFCAFLAPHDIPRSLVIKAAIDAGPGKAPELNSLAATALQEAGSDSLNVDPLAQQFAIQRLAVGERKRWAKRAVRTLAAHFPIDYAKNPSWCERLTPHALAAVAHAGKLDVERGASALLLNHVAGFLIVSGRRDEASRVLSQALDFATAAFGTTSPQVATVHANMTRLADPVLAGEMPGTFTHTDSSALAVNFTRLGDMRRDLGDLTGARRNYHAALGHAKSALGTHHELVTDLRQRLATLPALGAQKTEERRLLALGLAVIVVMAAVFAGAILWRDAQFNAPRAAGKPLAAADDLRDVCAERQRYFPDATAFGGRAPHPIQLFAQASGGAAFARENLYDPSGLVPPHWQADESNVREVQLVGCVIHRGTGAQITVCKVAGQREIPLYEATYEVGVHEARTGRMVGETSLEITRGSCPAQIDPPALGAPWQIYAAPTFHDYRLALGRYVEEDPATYAQGHPNIDQPTVRLQSP